MFSGYFYFMREKGLKVSLTEWMTLMRALSLDLSDSSLTRFYHLCRALCVKSETQFDLYDQCFAAYFEGAAAPASLKEELLEWLENPAFPRDISPEELAKLRELSLDELRTKLGMTLAFDPP